MIKSPKLYSFERNQIVTLKTVQDEKQYTAEKEQVQTHRHVVLFLPTQSLLVSQSHDSPGVICLVDNFGRTAASVLVA